MDPYWVHLNLKAQNSTFMPTSTNTSAIDLDFIPEVKPSKKYIINLEAKYMKNSQ